MTKIHKFNESLEIGKQGEAQFFELYKDKLEWLDGRNADFRILKDNTTIELKMDSYNPETTSNFFFERYSYEDRPGGCFQALAKGTTYYVYCFKQTMDIYVYNTKQLVDFLNENHPNPWLINIRNQAHVTRGFLVNRESLAKIRIPLEDIL